MEVQGILARQAAVDPFCASTFPSNALPAADRLGSIRCCRRPARTCSTRLGPDLAELLAIRLPAAERF